MVSGDIRVNFWTFFYELLLKNRKISDLNVFLSIQTMASEQIVDDSIWDCVCAKNRTFNEFLIEHQGDAIVFLCGDRQTGTLKSIIFDSINSAEALSFETVVSDGYTHTDPFAQPYVKIVLHGADYYISYADSEFILESPQFWRLTPVGKFKNSERQMCLTYSVSQYVPIIMNLGDDSESDVEAAAPADSGQASAEVSTAALETHEAKEHQAKEHQAKEQEAKEQEAKEQNQDTKSEILNQTRRLRIVKDFLRRTLKVKRT